MNRRKKVIIEGTSNAGKTTICELLSKEENYLMILESGRRVKHPKPSKNYKEEIYNQKFYFAEEIKRFIEADNLIKSNEKIILDRGLYMEAINTYEKSGNTAMEWQKKQLKNIMAVRSDDFEPIQNAFIGFQDIPEKLQWRDVGKCLNIYYSKKRSSNF
ncbi:hypothetical protein C815_01184 [Firmicutes bacterium M10-2]|nr:hypothetical protein C815_01184 [Firmicutes bacterium M10-2]